VDQPQGTSVSLTNRRKVLHHTRAPGGRTGVVFEATHLRLRQRVPVKKLEPELPTRGAPADGEILRFS
jgi:hypothetical protein